MRSHARVEVAKDHCGIEQLQRDLDARRADTLGTIRVETMNGIHPVNISVAVGAAHVGGGIPTPDEFIGFVQSKLPAEVGGITDGVWGR